MNDKLKLWLSMAVIIVVFVVGFIYTGLVNQSKPEKTESLPTNAINVVDQGNGWYSFDLEVGKNTITVVHFFEKPPVKEDTAKPIGNEFLRDWQKDSDVDDVDDDPDDDLGVDDDLDE